MSKYIYALSFSLRLFMYVLRSYSSPKCCCVIWNSLFTADVVGRSKKPKNRTDIRYFKKPIPKTEPTFIKPTKKTKTDTNAKYRHRPMTNSQGFPGDLTCDSDFLWDIIINWPETIATAPNSTTFPTSFVTVLLCYFTHWSKVVLKLWFCTYCVL